MRSKAHYRRCLELNILPVPASVDDSQIDQEILASQQKLSRESKIKVWLLPFMMFITERSNKVIRVNVNFPEISMLIFNCLSSYPSP